MKRITPLQTYQLFNTMKLAFNGKYDFKKYGFYNKRFGIDSYNKSWLRHECQKFNNNHPYEEETKKIFAANFVRDPAIQLGKIDKDKAINIKRYESSLYDYKEDSKQIFSKYTLRELLNKDEPLILALLSTGEITPEWFAITDKVLPISKLLDEANNFMWNIVKDRLTNYKSFVIIDSVEQVKELRSFLLEIANKN